VKKILIFFIFISLFGCSYIKNNNKELVDISCPAVFFSSERSTYISSFQDKIDLDSIGYKANLNNFSFSRKCFNDSTFNNYILDLLIIVEPINPINDEINLPIFVLLYDENEQLIDKQFFKVNKTFEYDKLESEYNITEIIQSLHITSKYSQKINSIIIGFVKVKFSF